MIKNILVFLLLSITILFAQPKSEAGKFVYDFANILGSNTETLNKRVLDFERNTEIQIAIVTISSLDGKDAQDSAISLANKWGIGKKGADNGILIFIAPKERKWRIEIGRGLEPYITDAEAKIFGEKSFKENFKKGDYFAGISLVLDKIIDRLGQDSWALREMALKEAAAQREKAKRETVAALWSAFFWIVFFGFVSLIGTLIYRFFKKRKIRKKLHEDIQKTSIFVHSYIKNLRAKLEAYKSYVNLPFEKLENEYLTIEMKVLEEHSAEKNIKKLEVILNNFANYKQVASVIESRIEHMVALINQAKTISKNSQYENFDLKNELKNQSISYDKVASMYKTAELQNKTQLVRETEEAFLKLKDAHKSLKQGVRENLIANELTQLLSLYISKESDFLSLLKYPQTVAHNMEENKRKIRGRLLKLDSSYDAVKKSKLTSASERKYAEAKAKLEAAKKKISSDDFGGALAIIIAAETLLNSLTYKSVASHSSYSGYSHSNSHNSYSSGSSYDSGSSFGGGSFGGGGAGGDW